VQDSDLCPLCKKSVIEHDSDQDSTAGPSGSAAATDSAAAPNVGSSHQGDDDQEDAPLLLATSRRRPRRYGSRLHGNTAVTFFML